MKTARQLSIFLLSITALFAFLVSYHMITDEGNAFLGLPFYLLTNSNKISIPLAGWVLFFSVALLSSFTIVCIFFRARFYSLLIMGQGAFICLYIFSEMILLGETFLIQYVTLILGGGLIGLGALQNQRKIIADIEKRNLLAKPSPKSHHHKHRKKSKPGF